MNTLHPASNHEGISIHRLIPKNELEPWQWHTYKIAILPLRPFLCSTVHSFVLHIVSKALGKSIKATYSFLCLSSCFWTNVNRVKIWSKVLCSCLKPACSSPIISLSSIHLVIRLFNTKLYSLLHMLSKDIPCNYPVRLYPLSYVTDVRLPTTIRQEINHDQRWNWWT